jgi:DNA-binding transcriptional ArsR family regulator
MTTTMEPLDITTDELRQQGYSLKIETNTIALYHHKTGSSPLCRRFGIYPKDWNKTVRQVEKGLAEARTPPIINSAVLEAMAVNYDKLVNGHSGSGTRKQQQHQLALQMAPKANKASCSIDEWRTTVRQKYNQLKAIVDEQIPGLWLPLEFTISIKCILNIKEITIPFIGIVLGPPSSLKSVTVDMPKHARDTYATDNFSPKAFVSHNSNLSEEELQEQDMLPKMKNKMFLTSELAPLFTTKDDELANIFGIITRIADGNGYFSDSGARGHRGYPGPLMFVWLGAAVDIPYKVHKILSMLGPKLYFLRLPMLVEDEDSLLRSIQQEDFPTRIRKVKAALFDYLEYLESCPKMQMDPESGIPKLDWDSKDPRQEQAQRYIIRLAELLAYLRGTVPTWKTEDTQGLDYAYASRNIENPKRAVTQLHNLAKGHALSQGRDHITIDDDLPLIVKVVLSGAASIERVKVLDALLDKKDRGYMTVSELKEVINTSDTTAKRAMAELKALGLVDLITLGEGDNALLQMRLKDNFDWFYGEEFKKLKGDYTPGDFKNYLVKKKKDKEQEQSVELVNDNRQ